MNATLTVFIINPFQSSAAFHTETSQLICSANQMTGFNMKYNTGLKWLNNKIIKKTSVGVLLVSLLLTLYTLSRSIKSFY